MNRYESVLILSEHFGGTVAAETVPEQKIAKRDRPISVHMPPAKDIIVHPISDDAGRFWHSFSGCIF